MMQTKLKSPCFSLLLLCFFISALSPSLVWATPCSDSIQQSFAQWIQEELPARSQHSWQKTSFAFQLISPLSANGPLVSTIMPHLTGQPPQHQIIPGITNCSGAFQGNRNTYPASSIKTLVAFTLMRALDAGTVRLDDWVTISQSNAAIECRPNCSKYGPGKRIQVRTLLEDMITVSSNLATNQLADLVSKDRIQQTADLLGAHGLRFWRKVYQTQNPEPEIARRNEGNALDFLRLYEEIANPRLHLLSNESLEILRGTLARQRHNNRFNREIPQSRLPFLHKTGSTSDSSSDAGYFLLPDGSILILAGLQDFRYFLSFGEIGKKLVQSFWNGTSFLN